MDSASTASAGSRGLWRRLTERTRSLFEDGLRAVGPSLGDAFFADLEELLIVADLGVSLAGELTEAVRRARPRTIEEARARLAVEIRARLSPRPRGLDLAARPTCILFAGINGAGKTTTVGKLAHSLYLGGLQPLVVIADTYRAAAVEQGRIWAERAGVPSHAGAPGADPGAVVFDGLAMAASRGNGVVLVDTAGRLQTQHNLVEELRKIVRVAGRALAGAPQEALLVLDGSLGQSSLAQARGFAQAVPLTGLVITKLDGSARGGALVAIEKELQVPTKLVGTGEGLEDLAEFDPDQFIDGILGISGGG